MSMSFGLSEDQAAFKQLAHEFARDVIRPVCAKYDQTGEFPHDVLRQAHELGLMNTHVEPDNNGFGLNGVEGLVIAEELAWGCTGIGTAIEANGLSQQPIILGASDALKKKYLEPMIDEVHLSAYCVTEPGAGSDVQGMRSTAVLKGDTYILNGRKMWTSTAQEADKILLLVRTQPRDPDKKRAEGLSLFYTDFDRDYIEARVIDKMGRKAVDSNAVFFDGLPVPVDDLIGEEGMGFVYLMQELPQERLGIAINGLAMAESAFQHTLDYVKERKAFGQRVADFQNTQFKMAEMSTKLDVARAYVDRCLEMHLKKELDIPTAAGAKYWVTDLQCEIIDECVQLHGGYGYMWEYPIARMYADARVQRIYGGTNEIMKTIISRALLA